MCGTKLLNKLRKKIKKYASVMFLLLPAEFIKLPNFLWRESKCVFILLLQSITIYIYILCLNVYNKPGLKTEWV